MKVIAAVLAAGLGSRFGSDKAHLLLGDKPMWRWAHDRFSAHPEIDRVLVVARRESSDRFNVPESAIAFGGKTRQESVQSALNACNDEDILVLHDAARPFVSDDLITRVVRAAKVHGAAAPAVSVSDTIRKFDGNRAAIIDRRGLKAMQTPQAIRANWLRHAFRQSNIQFTDDVALIENMGKKVEFVEGESCNIKVTTPGDLVVALSLAAAAHIRQITRSGFGYDAHRFSADPARKLVLGGVEFEDHAGLEGHSDADVLCHAIADALLGSAGLPDIGVHFPVGDPKWKNTSSLVLLQETRSLVEREGWRILFVDATLVAETPRIAPHSLRMKQRISDALGLDPSRVNIKATTNEGLGFVGRSEGLCSYGVATVFRYD